MPAALISAPAIEPVSIAEAKAHLRIDGNDENDLIGAMLVAARVHIEQLARRVLVEQGWRVYLDQWPRKRIVTLSPAPLISVDQVTVYDGDGEPVTVDPEDYEVDAVACPGRLILLSPAHSAVGRAANGIEIDVTAGYGPSGIDVPAPLRQAIMMLAANIYEHRGPAGHDLGGHVAPPGVHALIAPYRILKL